MVKKKTLKIDAEIDLHGYSVENAYIKTKSFLSSSRAMERKYVQIITGKSGIIRKEFQFWVENLGFKIVEEKAGSFVIKTL